MGRRLGSFVNFEQVFAINFNALHCNSVIKNRVILSKGMVERVIVMCVF